jgi:two-component system, chemotaxis family, sensor kinase CheA
VTQHSDERGAELRELFFETAQELLQALNDEALKLEKRPGDVETVRSIRRIVHTLKGDAAACGYRELSELAHEFEDVMGTESASGHSSLAEVSFAAADIFAAMLTAYHKKRKLPSTQALHKMIGELAASPEGRKGRKKQTPAPASAALWSEYEKLAVQTALRRGKRVYHVAAVVDPHCAMPIAARQLVLNGLTTIGEILAARPEAGSVESTQRLEFLLATEKAAEAVATKCKIPTVIAQVKVEAIKGKTRKTKAATEDGPTTDPVQQTTPAPLPETLPQIHPEEPEADIRPPGISAVSENILRVDAERIDNVLNLVGELIIGKSMLQQALNEFARIYPKEAIRGRFADAMAFQARVLNDLQRSVMKIRMVPVEQLFRRFPRMVRDVAKQCGRQVELALSGQDTDLDKSILDAIAEPLTHLVRNAVGHGIESPEERQRLGKPAHGTVRLDAYHHGNQVIVEVSDDGRGIDLQKVKAKAIEQQIVNSEDVARMSEGEIMNLVFRPGFSTADEITEVAGRGVGLDVVQSVLQRLKGTVSIETRPGQGTTFRLKLPLTLAIIKALLFRIEHRLYAIPLNTVAEIARAHESDLHQVDSYEVLQMRNQVLPLLRLGRPPEETASPKAGKVFVLVIHIGERKLGLIVDSLEGEEELVIKALDDQTVATDLVSGASILGDGRVVLVLNLAAVVDRYTKARPQQAGQIVSGLLLSRSDSSPEVRP